MSELFPRNIYIVNERHPDLIAARAAQISSLMVLDALDDAHLILDQFVKFEVDVFAILGMRNLSAFIGELFAAAMIKVAGGLFRKNPHQDGYPDLLVMDDHGAALWGALARNLRAKAPFSPFAGGGVEVKATCGSVPTPAALGRRGLEKPGIGDQRITLMTSYDWKAHHRDTNNLLGILWYFIEGVPRIVGVFYCNSLVRQDWSEIIQPREGGGRTTSVSIMTRDGVQKMFTHWVVLINDPRYISFLERRNGIKLQR